MKTHLLLSVSLLTGLLLSAGLVHAMPTPDDVPPSLRIISQAEPDKITPEILTQAAKALTAGLTTLQIHKDAEKTTPLDRQIIKIMDEDCPAVLNNIVREDYDFLKEISSLSWDAAELILKNQTKYQADKINMEAAANIMIIINLQAGRKNPQVTPETQKILTDEFIEAFQQQLISNMLFGQ